MRFTDAFLDDLRDRVTISDVVGTRVTWDRKKTRPNRGDWWACCPFHGESRPSFHCEDRKGRYHCFGCGCSGDHFRFFVQLDGVSFPRAVEMVADLAGVPMPNARPENDREKQQRLARERDRARRAQQRDQQERRESERKADTVRSLWAEGIPVAGSLAERYLSSRSIELSDFQKASVWPPSLRFHPGLFHDGRRYPALIGGVQNKDRKLVALWRIFLQPDGRALVGADGKKLKLGLGPATGGAVRLGPASETLRVAEGIETSLAVALLTRESASVWATLSTSGMVGFEIPAGTRRLEIYADGDRHRLNKQTGEVTDPPGIRAAQQLQQKARASGIDAVIFPSPEPDDWLNVWEARKADEQRVRNVQYSD